MSDWIAIEDRLPELNKVVLVCWKNENNGSPIYGWGARLDESEGWLWGTGARWGVSPREDAQQNDIEADDDYQVTHWMPLFAEPSSYIKSKD